jgi:hypothetical protein
MAQQPCLPQVQACALRVTALAANGSPAPGASNGYVTNAFVSVAITPVYTDGDEIEQKNACGAVCVNYKSPDSFKRLDLSIQLCTPDPELVQLLAGGTVLGPAFGGITGAKGYAAPAIGVLPTTGISLELWTKRIDDGALDADSPYARWAFPLVNNVRVGAWTHENGPLLPTYTAQAYENVNWLNGGFNDWEQASDRVFQWGPEATLPTVQCGYVTVPAHVP